MKGKTKKIQTTKRQTTKGHQLTENEERPKCPSDPEVVPPPDQDHDGLHDHDREAADLDDGSGVFQTGSINKKLKSNFV